MTISYAANLVANSRNRDARNQAGTVLLVAVALPCRLQSTADFGAGISVASFPGF